jgi:hypothetical protein
MYLNDDKYPNPIQERFWSFYYHVFDYLVKKGLEGALEKYPRPIVQYFDEWRKINKKRK